MNELEIYKKTNQIIFNNKTLDEVAEDMNIQIEEIKLSGTDGFYIKRNKRKIIFLNSDLSFEKRNFILAHELGHSILHESLHMAFSKINTYHRLDRYETEADFFATCLIINDEVIKELCIENDYTSKMLADKFGIAFDLIEKRINLFKEVNC